MTNSFEKAIEPDIMKAMITGLQAENRKLEAENRRLMNEVADYSDECHELTQQTVDLEAENKELRDILKNLISCENFEQYIKEHNKAIEALK